MSAHCFVRNSCNTANILIERLIYFHVSKVFLMRAIVCGNSWCMGLTNIGVKAELVRGKILNSECVVSQTCRDRQLLFLSLVWGFVKAGGNCVMRFQLFNTSACVAFLVRTVTLKLDKIIGCKWTKIAQQIPARCHWQNIMRSVSRNCRPITYGLNKSMQSPCFCCLNALSIHRTSGNFSKLPRFLRTSTP